MKKLNRRDFVRNAGMAATAFSIVPSTVFGKSFGHISPSDKLNIAGIGVGGMGRNNLRNMSGENIVALCDVDWNYAAKTFADYPNAKKFKDWRDMFDNMGDSIDAVMVATPDHTHAGVTAHAITLGKHVYTQKPLTHSVYESRLLNALAKKYGVATQMGIREILSPTSAEFVNGFGRVLLAKLQRYTPGQTGQFGHRVCNVLPIR